MKKIFAILLVLVTANVNAASCYNWQTTPWTACSSTACGTKGTQTRDVTCQLEGGILSAESICTEVKPLAFQECVNDPCPYIDVTKYGAKSGDGLDDLVAVNQAIAAAKAGETVYVPAGMYDFDVSETKNIRLKSDITFEMSVDAILKVKPNALARYYLINGNAVKNVIVTGGQLVGDRYQHKGTTGEWGYGVKIGGGSDNVKIMNVKVKDFWGDGLATGGVNNLLITGVVSTNNRRQGLSLTNASNNVIVEKSEFSYTNGTAPESGIDIEPDLPRTSRNITIRNNKIHHNAKPGIIAYINTSDVKILNNEIYNNNHGIYIRGSQIGTIEGNVIKHNNHHAIRFEEVLTGQQFTKGYTVSNNKFINNLLSSSSINPNDGNGPLTSITGTSTSSDFKNHILIHSACCGKDPLDKPKFLTNQYAR